MEGKPPRGQRRGSDRTEEDEEQCSRGKDDLVYMGEVEPRAPSVWARLHNFSLPPGRDFFFFAFD